MAPAAQSAFGSWYDRPMRWAQLTLVEDDPGKYDPAFWLEYFRRTHSDAACLSAGGCVAVRPERCRREIARLIHGPALRDVVLDRDAANDAGISFRGWFRIAGKQHHSTESQNGCLHALHGIRSARKPDRLRCNNLIDDPDNPDFISPITSLPVCSVRTRHDRPGRSRVTAMTSQRSTGAATCDRSPSAVPHDAAVGDGVGGAPMRAATVLTASPTVCKAVMFRIPVRP